MKRPAGITILAVLDFQCAALGLYVAAAMPSMAREMPVYANLLGTKIVVFFLFFCVFPAALGIGLWRLQNWARYVTFIFSGPNMLVAQFPDKFIGWTMVPLNEVLKVGIWAWIVWYLLRPHVKAAFQAHPPRNQDQA